MEKDIQHAVIMAGGKGTRLSAITKGEIPKPMVPIEGKPLLEWQIEQLKRYGIFRITMVIGHLGHKIEEYFGDGRAFGVAIDYIVENKPLGTAGALGYVGERLISENFLLIFGDIFFDIDIPRMVDFHRNHHAQVTLFAHPNAHPYDSDLIVSDQDGRVIKFDSKNNVRNYWYNNCVNAGLYVMNKSFCRHIVKLQKIDLEKEILAVMAEQGEPIYAYISPEYVKDVGTVDRIEATMKELSSGLIQKKNLENPQRAIFLDRDGTINQYCGFLDHIDDFVLEKNVISAIRRINQSGMMAIVVSNQPVVARGQCTMEDIENIHKKMSTLLGKEGVYLDDVFFCPHHPDRGFEGENLLYKVDCDCRKPKPGMIFEAAKKWNLDLENSWMIGDSTIDLETGRRGGLHTALVQTGLAGEDGKFSRDCEIEGRDLLEVVEKIIKK